MSFRTARACQRTRPDATIVWPMGTQLARVGRQCRSRGDPVQRVLHLKSAVTALPDGTVIGYPPNVARPAQFTQFLAFALG